MVSAEVALAAAIASAAGATVSWFIASHLLATGKSLERKVEMVERRGDNLFEDLLKEVEGKKEAFEKELVSFVRELVQKEMDAAWAKHKDEAEALIKEAQEAFVRLKSESGRARALIGRTERGGNDDDEEEMGDVERMMMAAAQGAGLDVAKLRAGDQGELARAAKLLKQIGSGNSGVDLNALL